jgi:hypothetical protein
MMGSIKRSVANASTGYELSNVMRYSMHPNLDDSGNVYVQVVATL